MTRVIMHGCSGKMGHVITEICSQDPEVQIVAGIDPVAAADLPYPVFSAFADCDVEADVVIDFSNAAAADELLFWCGEQQMPLVLCTTGLSREQLELAEKTAEKTAVLRSANMSLGINLLLKLVQTAAEVLADAGFDIEIVEQHHNQKVDAPSGTAVALADAMNEALQNSYYYKYDRSKERAKRDAKEIGISAVRGGSIVGVHDVIFAGKDEVVTLNHTAYSKAIFAKGAVQAAKYLAGKPAGMYSMQNVIG